MQDRYRSVPLRAFDYDGNPILPLDYQRELRGADVYVEIWLEHRRVAGNDQFRAFLDHIRVLDPPCPSTPVLEPRVMRTYDPSRDLSTFNINMLSG